MSADTAWTRGYIGRLHIGLKLHAMYADGFFYAAEVVGISAFRRHRKAPVKIHYLGYARADDEWVPVGRLRSKILRRAAEQPKCLWRPLVRLPSPPRLPPAPVAKAPPPPPLLELPLPPKANHYSHYSPPKSMQLDLFWDVSRIMQAQGWISWQSWLVARWARDRRRNALSIIFEVWYIASMAPPSDSDDLDWDPWAGLQ